jgi:GntR family transcriptional repressor for pyruvate dehydrogenase complex
MAAEANTDSGGLSAPVAAATKRADAVFEDLQARIFRGEMPIGSRLPPERELAAEYDITRNTLRESIRALEQERLVTVRQGQGVTVADFRRTGRLTLLAAFLEHGASPAERVQVLLDALQARAAVLQLAITVAVERARPEDMVRLEAAGRAQKAAFHAHDPVLLGRGELTWMNALIDAAHSMTVRWIANSFLEVFEAILTRMPSLWVIDAGYADWIDDVLDAFQTRQSERAAELLNEYFRRTDASLRVLLSQVLAHETGGTDE